MKLKSIGLTVPNAFQMIYDFSVCLICYVGVTMISTLWVFGDMSQNLLDEFQIKFQIQIHLSPGGIVTVTFAPHSKYVKHNINKLKLDTYFTFMIYII